VLREFPPELLVVSAGRHVDAAFETLAEVDPSDRVGALGDLMLPAMADSYRRASDRWRDVADAEVARVSRLVEADLVADIAARSRLDAPSCGSDLADGFVGLVATGPGLVPPSLVVDPLI